MTVLLTAPKLEISFAGKTNKQTNPNSLNIENQWAESEGKKPSLVIFLFSFIPYSTHLL